VYAIYSCAEHQVSPSTIDDLLSPKRWKPMTAYPLSKLVQMHLFQIVVDSFAEVEGIASPVAIAVSPGKSHVSDTIAHDVQQYAFCIKDLFLRQVWPENIPGGCALS
jgi:hypothetical protein